MPDVHDAATRSFNMSRVHSSENKSTELSLIAILRDARITGWRRRSRLHGRPDFVFPRYRVAVFVDGCFWHGCPKACKPLPRNNRFWEEKIAANMRRDRLVTRDVRRKGWRVLRIWEHELRNAKSKVVRKIESAIDKSEAREKSAPHRSRGAVGAAVGVSP